MRVSEVYASVQGEGPNVGQTTVFVRFGGCNLRCPGWPCDTDHAINPAFRNEWKVMSPVQLYERTEEVARMSGAQLITLTGGEPFLQNNNDLETFVYMLLGSGYKVEAFTNGTFIYPDWAVENVSMIMDWKLPGSGEDPSNENRRTNLAQLDQASIWHSVKFVCKDVTDFHYAYALWSSLPENQRTALHWYYGKVWNGDITDAELVELVMKNQLPWRLNVQMHNLIWPANERGR